MHWPLPLRQSKDFRTIPGAEKPQLLLNFINVKCFKIPPSFFKTSSFSCFKKTLQQKLKGFPPMYSEQLN